MQINPIFNDRFRLKKIHPSLICRRDKKPTKSKVNQYLVKIKPNEYKDRLRYSETHYKMEEIQQYKNTKYNKTKTKDQFLSQ